MNEINVLNSKLLGSYFQSFFCIELHTDESLDDLNKLKEETISTLLHEYIHFLQDITTSFGLTNIISIVNHQKLVNQTIIDSDLETFKTPVEVDINTESDIYNALHSIFIGDFESDFDDYSKIIGYDLLPNEYVQGYEHHLYVSINFEKFGQNKSFNFGAIQIMESMAFIVERNMFNNIKSPIYPYHIVEKIIEFIYPEILGNDALIVSICDFSLMLPDPGRFFLIFIKDLKTKGIINVEDAYNLFKHTIVVAKDVKSDIFQFYCSRVELALISLKDYFTIDYFKDINNWFEQIFEKISTYKLENFTFWNEILSGDNIIQKRNNLINLSFKFGFPLIVNSEGQTVFSNPENLNPENLFSFRAIKEVSGVLKNEHTQCNMVKMCKNGIEDITDHTCNTPWNRNLDNKLCPFTAIIRMWGIDSKQPISSNY